VNSARYQVFNAMDSKTNQERNAKIQPMKKCKKKPIHGALLRFGVIRVPNKKGRSTLDKPSGRESAINAERINVPAKPPKIKIPIFIFFYFYQLPLGST